MLQYVAMDEPFYFASVHVEPASCQRSAREVAQNAVANLNVLKKEFPDLQVGDIEPVPAFEGPGWVERYREWVEAYELPPERSWHFYMPTSVGIHPPGSKAPRIWPRCSNSREFRSA